MSSSTELRRIVGAMTERPWRNGADPSHFDSPEVTDGKTFAYYVTTERDAVAIAALANHADAIVALVEACERRREARCWSRWSEDDMRTLNVSVHDCLCGEMSDANECPISSSDRGVLVALAAVHAVKDRP